MRYKRNCGCEFEVDVRSACCGSCYCMCDSSDAFDCIEDIDLISVCKDHVIAVT